MSSLPHLSFVIHDIEGGVASMNHQIIEHADFGRYFKVRIILWKREDEPGKEFAGAFGEAVEIVRFRYAKWDNFHVVLKRLSVLLEERPGALVTNDGMELSAIARFGTRSVVFSIVHDFYNLKLAVESFSYVDYFLCHTETYARTLRSNPLLRDRVGYLLHGVRVIPVAGVHGSIGGVAMTPTVPAMTPGETRRKLRIVSISRLIAAKGVLLFRRIEDILVDKGIGVEWLVIGSGELEAELTAQWAGKNNITFSRPDTLEEVYRQAYTGDIFISPSSFEGYGIALLEAMSCGLVPVIGRLPVGIYADLPEQVAFSLDGLDAEDFADRIEKLDKDRTLLATMGTNAGRLVAQKYDIDRTAVDFMNYFREYATHKITGAAPVKKISNFGVLDKAYLPNGVTRLIKRFKQ
jgi:glycosyltransferase involved in cell wall biosynthesis